MNKERQQEIKEIALKLAEGKMICNFQVPEAMWKTVFMPLLFLEEKMFDEIFKCENPAVLLLGDTKDAGARGMNGYPMFMSMSFVKKSEYSELRKIHNNIATNRAKLLDKEVPFLLPDLSE